MRFSVQNLDFVAARFFQENASNFLLFKNEALSRTETNLIETNNYPTLRLAETDKIYVGNFSQ